MIGVLTTLLHSLQYFMYWWDERAVQ
jgi:hypothetical protein